MWRATIDLDAGVVEFDDFLKIVLEHRSVEDAPKEILAAFQHYDTQRMGFIDAKQLKYILTHTGEKLTDRDGKTTRNVVTPSTSPSSHSFQSSWFFENWMSDRMVVSITII